MTTFAINDYVDNSTKVNRVSSDYIGTTYFLDDVREIQNFVKNVNKMVRRTGMPTASVKINTRLGLNSPNAWKYEGEKAPYIKIDDAERFDIYLKTNV